MDTKFVKPLTTEKPNASKEVEKPKMYFYQFPLKFNENNDLTKSVTLQPLPKQKEK